MLNLFQHVGFDGNHLVSYHHLMLPISSTQHSTVLSLLQEDYSVCKISQKTDLGRSNIGRIKKDLDSNKENLKGGHPSKLSPSDKRTIVHQIMSGNLDNAVQATHFINQTLSSPVKPQTVRRALKESELLSAVKRKAPMLKREQRLACLKFARYHANWTVEDWKRVLWSDETKINRIGSDGRTYIWKRKGELPSDRTTTPTVKHGGGNNLMVWGCMGWNGVGVLTEVQGIMDSQQYCEILEEGLVESFENLEMEEEERIFQQDNDPKNTSKNATKWF